MKTRGNKALIKALPKAELHVHLEGTVTPAFWHALLSKHPQEGAVPSLAELAEKYNYTSFAHFLEVFRDIIFSFRTPDDLYDLTHHYLATALKQNIRYCEVMMTPWFLVQRGIDYHEMMAEIDRAAKEVEKSAPIEMKLILDGPRNFGREVVKEVFTMAAKDRTGRVIAVGLGGDEENYPAQWYAEAFDYARSEGLKTIAHAGETAGEQSMLDTINYLQVSRLGHCLGIPKSSQLEELIFDKSVTLDLCPWSNVSTGVIGSISEHPMFDYLQRNYPITLNSDDPGMFGNSLILEYETIEDLYHLSPAQLAKLTKNAFQGSFLPEGTKKRLMAEVDQTCDIFQDS